MDVAIVGGGAVGITLGGDLAARDVDVTLFERETLGERGGDESGSGSSGRAAGVLYDAYAEDVDARIGARSMERFRELSESLSFAFTPCPYVIAAADEETADALPSTVDRMRTHGRDVSVVDPETIGERYPLASDDLLACAVANGAGYVEPVEYLEVMATRARDAGVAIRTRTAVELTDEPGTIETDDGRERFDAVVVAAGAHTPSLFADVDVSLPVKPYRVQALTSSREYGGPMVYDATGGAYFRPHPTGLLAGDGTEPVEADPDTWDREADGWFRSSVAETLRKRASYEPEVDRSWAGLCTATPDRDPLVGEVYANTYVATGWQGHGFMRVPGIAEALAEEILGGDGIDQFDPCRFSGNESFTIAEGMTIEDPEG